MAERSGKCPYFPAAFAAVCALVYGLTARVYEGIVGGAASHTRK